MTRDCWVGSCRTRIRVEREREREREREEGGEEEMKKVHTLCCVCERFDHLRHDQTHDQRLLGGQL